jgi:hypothetical protein
MPYPPEHTPGPPPDVQPNYDSYCCMSVKTREMRVIPPDRPQRPRRIVNLDEMIRQQQIGGA